VNIDGIVQGLYSGISFGMILVLIASGLTLIFGLIGVINFAHGEIYALGAYIGFFAFGITGNFLISLPAAALATAFVGGVMEVSIIRPLYERDPLYQLAVTFGAGIIIIEAVQVYFGSINKRFPVPEYLQGTVNIASYGFGFYRLFLIISGSILIAMLWWFISRSDFGLIIRAAIFDTEMVESMGYNLKRVYTLTFMLGSAYAAIAGVLVSPIFGVFPEMGAQILILTFVVVVAGGLGSFKGAVVTGLLIGIVQSFGRIYTPTFAEMIPFMMMILIILYRPEGLFGVQGIYSE
jgi:branched-subunit amino acid ABC-type transport system permease component